jgi:hypothetical protein
LASVLLSLVFLGEARGAPPSPDLAACSAAFSAAPDLAKSGKLLAARARLTLCAADPCPGSMRALCAEDLRHLQEQIPTVVFAAKGAHGEDLIEVHVTENGNRIAEKLDGVAVELDPGAHTFHFADAKSGRSTDQTILVREGERARVVTVTLSELAQEHAQTDTNEAQPSGATQARPVPWTVFFAGAVTIAAAGSFGVFGGLGLSERSNLSGCKGFCSSGSVNQVSTNFTIADVSWITGLVALATTGVLYFTRPTLRATATRNGLVLGTTF